MADRRSPKSRRVAWGLWKIRAVVGGASFALSVALTTSTFSAGTNADETRPKADNEPYPQSAKIFRDRRAEAVFESARSQLAKSDHAAAIAALQTLLDGPNGFTAAGAHGRSVLDEANRLLAEMPPTARALYERVHGPEAERLWREARRGGQPEKLGEVVVRYGQTVAGWRALSDIVQRHFDRSEWQLAAAASETLSRHPHSAVTKEFGWIARWVLALGRQERPANTAEVSGARAVLARHKTRLEKSPAPPLSTAANMASWLEQQLVVGRIGNPSYTIADGPATKEVWQFSTGADGEPLSWLTEILAGWRDYDVLALPSVQPLVIGDVVVARFVHPSKVVAVDVRQARLLWEKTGATQLGSTATDLQRHPGIRGLLLDEIQRQWYGDSVRGRLTTDGRRLFLVQDADELDLKPGSGTRLRNHLESWDLATGARLWRVGTANQEPPAELQGVYFLGPPLVSDGWLYVVGQRETMVALWALRADDGQPSWFLPLAETDRQQFKESDWRHIACPVTWSDGRLVCPTGAGCLVAVDPVTRSLAWNLRFERDDISSATGFTAADRDRPFPSRWWESWREVWCRELRAVSPESKTKSSAKLSTLDSGLSTLVVATPESRSLRGLDARTGEVRWRVPFDEPLFATASGESPVLVFQRHDVAAIEPLTGKILWRTPLPSPSGPGEWLISGELESAAGRPPTRSFFYPLQDGGWTAIDTSSGALSRWPALAESSMGRLARAGDRWVALSPDRLRVFDSIATRERILAERLRTKSDDAASRLELARISRQANNWAKAEALLRPLLVEPIRADEARAEMRQTWLARIDAEPSEGAQFAKELLSLSRDVGEQVVARHALLVAAQRSGALVEALRGALELLDLHPADEVTAMDRDLSSSDPLALPGPVSLPGPLSPSPVPFSPLPGPLSPPGRGLGRGVAERTLRRDRWLQGFIVDLFAQADGANGKLLTPSLSPEGRGNQTKTEDQTTRKQLDSVLAERRQRAVDSLDAFALPQLAEQLSCLPIARAIRLKLSGRTGIGVGFLRTNLALQEIANGSDRVTAAEAWYRLALLHEFRSEPLEAADCYRELRDRFADVKLPDGRSAAEWLTDVMPDSAIGRSLENGPADPWPQREPDISRLPEPHNDTFTIYFHPIPVESRDPFWRRVSVSVHRQGTKVRFHGAGQRGYWELPLPESKSWLRHAYTMHRAWGLGPLLVLQVGADLFGIQPLDDRGETNPQLLWTVTSRDGDEMGGREFRPGRLGVSNDDEMYLDRYLQPLLEVVHASPGLLCFRAYNRLIAIDPVKGTRLWTWHHLPPRTAITSDGDFVLLRLPDAGEIEVLRAFDGRRLARRLDDVAPSAIVFEQGRLRLLEVGRTSTQAFSPATVAPLADATPAENVSRRLTLRCDDLVSGQTRWQRDFTAGAVPLRVDEQRLGVIDSTKRWLRFLSLDDGSDLAEHKVELPTTLSHVHVFGDERRLFVILAGSVTETSWLATEQVHNTYRRPLVNGWLRAFDRRTLQPLWTVPARNLVITLDQPCDTPFLLLSYYRPSDDSSDGKSVGVLHAIDKRTGKELLFEVGGVNSVYFALDPDPSQSRVDLLSISHRIRFDYSE